MINFNILDLLSNSNKCRPNKLKKNKERIIFYSFYGNKDFFIGPVRNENDQFEAQQTCVKCHKNVNFLDKCTISR